MKKILFVLLVATFSLVFNVGIASADFDSGLVAYYPFNGNANDESGNGHNGTVHGATLIADKFGTHDSAYSFDGATNYIDLGTWFNYQSFTISMWINPGSAQVQLADIIDNNHSASRSWVLQQDSSNTNSYYFHILPSANSIPFTLPANQWTHIIITRDISTKATTVYIDGAPLQSVISTDAAYYDGTQSLRLGGHASGGRNWNGLIDEVRIYDRVLSEDEITRLNIYNSTPFVWPTKATSNGPVTLTLTGDGFNQETKVSLSGTGLPQLTSVQTTFESSTTVSAVFDLSGVQTGIYDVLINTPREPQTKYSGAFEITDLNYGLVAYYPFNGNANDESGKGHSGTVYGAALTADKFGTPYSAYCFNGVNSYVDLGSWFNYQSFTISMWINPGSSQVQLADIIDNNHSASRSWVLQQDSSNTNSYYFINLPAPNGIPFTLNANEWTHVLISRDGSTRATTVYLNGVPLQNEIFTPTSAIPQCCPVKKLHVTI